MGAGLGSITQAAIGEWRSQIAKLNPFQLWCRLQGGAVHSHTFLLRLPSPLFGTDVSQVWDYANSVEQYMTPGGTSKSSVTAQIEQLRELLKKQK